MKLKKIFVILIVLLSMCGCSSKLSDSTNKLSEKILELHNSSNIDTSDLNDYEKEVLNKFLDNEKEDNKIINISEVLTFSGESYTTNPNTYGVYSKDNNYYIKYSDIKWVWVNNSYIAVIDIDGQEDALEKTNVPILYKDTHDNDRYVYMHVKTNVSKNKIDYVYKSLKDDSNLIIRYSVNGKKINNISLLYNNSELEEENEETKSSTNYALLIVPVLLGGIIYLMFKSFRH